MYEPFVRALSCLSGNLVLYLTANESILAEVIVPLIPCFLLFSLSISLLLTSSKLFLSICSNESPQCPWRCRFSCSANTQSPVNTYRHISWHRDLCISEGRFNIYKHIFMVGCLDLKCFLCLPFVWCDADVLPIKLVFLLIRPQFLL